jgi:hypothetical protein
MSYTSSFSSVMMVFFSQSIRSICVCLCLQVPYHAGTQAAHHCNRIKASVASTSGAGIARLGTARLDEPADHNMDPCDEDEDDCDGGYHSWSRRSCYEGYDSFLGFQYNDEYDSDDPHGFWEDPYDIFCNRMPQTVNPWAHANSDVGLYFFKTPGGDVQPATISHPSSTATLEPRNLEKVPIQDDTLLLHAVLLGTVDFPVAVHAPTLFLSFSLCFSLYRLCHRPCSMLLK